MSPRDKDRRKISGRVIGAAAAGAGVLLISIGALISNIGSGSDTPSPGAGVVRLELIAARDIGSLPARDSWCAGAEHCWTMQQSSGNATDLGAVGAWHLVPVGSPRSGVSTSLPIRDASGWVDSTTELGYFVDGAATDYYQRAGTVIESTNLVSVTFVITETVGNTEIFSAIGPPGVSGVSVYLGTNGQLVGNFWTNSVVKQAIWNTTGLTDGAWHCITVTLDGRTADSAKLWADGTEQVAVSCNLDDTAGIGVTATLKTAGGAGTMRGGIARWNYSETAYTFADHIAFCGDLWQAPAGGGSDNKPLASDDTWTQTAGAGCYPTSSTTVVCVPGGLMPYTVDATGIGWPVQQAITNPVLYSTAMDCTNWTCVGATSATYGKVAPDGSATATEITVALGANHFEQDISAGYTASASPLHLGMWLDCSSGLIHPHGSNDGSRGDWDVSCSCIGGQWTYIHADHPCVTVQIPFNADGSGDSGIHYDGTVVVDATVWAPTLTEQRAWSRVVIPTAASAVALGNPIWAIANGLGNKQPQLLADGSMDATDTSAWSAVNDADLSKQSSAPAEGVRWMRIAYDGTSNPYARQTSITTAGLIYRVTGWGTSDGTALPRVSGSSIYWTGSTSTDWQPFDIQFTAGATVLNFWALTTTAGFTGFDGVALYEQQASGPYYHPGDTVTQDLTEYAGDCFTIPGSDILLSGSPTCSGSWYSLKVQK